MNLTVYFMAFECINECIRVSISIPYMILNIEIRGFSMERLRAHGGRCD